MSAGLVSGSFMVPPLLRHVTLEIRIKITKHAEKIKLPHWKLSCKLWSDR